MTSIPTAASVLPARPSSIASASPVVRGGGLADIAHRLPLKPIIGGLVGAGLGFALFGPLGALGLGAIGAFIGAQLASHGSPNQSPGQG